LVLLGVVALLLMSSLPSQAGKGKSYGPVNPFEKLAMVYLWGITDDPSPWPLVASNDSPIRFPLHSAGPEDGYSLPVIVPRPYQGVVIVVWYQGIARPQPDQRGQSASIVREPDTGVEQRDGPARGVVRSKEIPDP
jgi:hypothetical protein